MSAIKRKIENDFLINSENGEHENALFFHFSRVNGNGKVMDEPTEELQYPFDELYEIQQDICNNAEWMLEALRAYLRHKEHPLKQKEDLVKLRRAIEELQSLANGASCRFSSIQWPDVKEPWIESDDDKIYDRFPVAACGERCNKDLSNKEML